MTVEYAVFDKDELLFICQDEDLAEEMVLALTEEFIYNQFLLECERSGLEMALWLSKSSKKYGWDRYRIKRVRRIVN